MIFVGTGALIDVLDGPTTYQGLPPPAGVTTPASLDDVGVSSALSDAASGDDPAAFVALFAPELQEGARRWHTNMRTLGVDRVLAVFLPERSRDLIDESINGILQVGFHIPGIDGVELEPAEPLPGMAVEPNRTPATEYAVTDGPCGRPHARFVPGRVQGTRPGQRPGQPGLPGLCRARRRPIRDVLHQRPRPRPDRRGGRGTPWRWPRQRVTAPDRGS